MNKIWKPLLLIVAAGALAIALYMSLSLREVGNDRLSFTALSTPARNVSGLAFDGTWLWMTIDGGQVIYQVEPTSWTVKREIPFPVKATGGSAWDGRTLWQLAYEEKKIYQLDLNTGQVLKVIPTPGAGQCSGTTYDGRYLWVANFEDKKLYQIDQENGGRIIQTLDGYFEATGLAWDGDCLWTGILVGTVSHDEETPYTGFVQQRDLKTKETKQVYHIPGVGPGTSDWVPAGKQAKGFWWYDGFNNQIVRVQLHHVPRRGLMAMTGALFMLALFSLGLAWQAHAVSARHRAGGES